MFSDIASHYRPSKFASNVTTYVADGEVVEFETRPCGEKHSLKLKCIKCIENREKAGLERKINDIGPDFRQWIYSRDNFACVNCGKDSPLTVDHKIPVIHGGKTDPDNLQTLCVPCNSSKGSKTWEQFRRKIEQ